MEAGDCMTGVEDVESNLDTASYRKMTTTTVLGVLGSNNVRYGGE